MEPSSDSSESEIHIVQEFMSSSLTEANMKLMNTISIQKQISLVHTRNFRHVEDVNSLVQWHENLGSGAYGSVYRATHKAWNTTVAIKVVNKNSSPAQMTLVKQELYACQMIQHPNIVRVLDLFEDLFNIYIVMEYVEQGNLLSFLTKGQGVTER